MPKIKLCHCGKPSLAGLKKGIALCRYHWAELIWGKAWADKLPKEDSQYLVQDEIVNSFKPIELRGRNGFFILKEAFVSGDPRQPEVSIHFESKRAARYSPVVIQGNPTDLVNLFDLLKAQLERSN